MSSAAWIQTVSGTKVDLLDPKPDQILIEDIAHALSPICRFTGHVEKFMSVAHHSVIVSNLVDPEFAFDGLMHDATEAYVNDLSRPLKNLLPEYKVVEERFALAIAEKFGVTHPLPNPAKITDSRATGYIDEFGYQSWELDALEPSVIVDLIRTNVEATVDFPDDWDDALQEDMDTRDRMKDVADRWDDISDRWSEIEDLLDS